MIWLSASLYSKFVLYTVNVCHLHLLATCKKISNELSEINDRQNCFSILVVLPWAIILFNFKQDG